MAWIYLMALLGLVFGFVYVAKAGSKAEVLGVTVLCVLIGSLVGTILGGISTFVLSGTLSEDEFVYSERVIEEIALSEEGDPLRFELVVAEGKTLASFVNGKSKNRTFLVDDCVVEFSDSEFVILERRKLVDGWRSWLAFPVEQTKILRVSEEAWKEANN